MEPMTAYSFAASLFFALVSVPMAIKADKIRQDLSAFILAMMSALFLYGGLRGL